MTMYDYVKQHLKNIRLSGDELHANCPFHADDKKSFSMNIKSGLWNCFAECGGGNFITYMSRTENITFGEAEEKFKTFAVDIVINAVPSKAEPLDVSVLLPKNKCLLENAKIMSKLLETRGITEATVRKYCLGYDGDRIWIPVMQGKEGLVNIRKYDIDKKYAGNYKLISVKGHGQLRLFPFDNLKKKDIVLCAGEMDCLIANQNGINAVTITGGEGSFADEFKEQLKGKNVYIVYDNDSAGKTGSIKVYNQLKAVANVKIIRLPVKEKGEDVTDYFIKYKATAKDFLALLNKEPAQEKEAKVYPVDLDQSTLAKYYFKDVQMKVIVAGKDLAPYFVPRKIKVTCDGQQKKCQLCPLFGESEYTLEISHRDPDMLNLINCSKDQQLTAIKKKIGIVNCYNCKIDILETSNIEDLRVIAEIDFSARDKEYVARQIYNLGEPIHTNRSYLLTGITMPNPKNQYATQLIYDNKPVQNSIDNFQLTKEDAEKLKLFQVTGRQTIEQKLEELYNDLTYNVTNIYHRQDIMAAVDLVYHSALQFKFRNKLVTRGWVEALIIGDTRSGKTETISKMIDHYKAGELITGENTSFAGLVGGMQQTQERWSISWGKIPLNDRRLIVIDEASGLTLEHISAMSGIRSSGIAEIVKIQTERTFARTRLLWLSNPRSGRKLESYNYGVYAIKELFGRVEDIARLDLAVTCASKEVAQADIHKMSQPKFKHTYKSNLCNKLVMFIWSRLPEQILFDKDAEQEVMDQSMRLGGMYSSLIPLIEGAEQRIKLARLSVALAGRLFSVDKDLNILVKKEHVRHIAKYLHYCYTKPSMGYDIYSASQKHTEEISNVDLAKVKAEFKLFMNWHVLRDLFLDHQFFRKHEIIDQIGYDKEDEKRLFQWLGKHRLIKSTSAGYIKHPVFTNLMKGLIHEQYQEVISKNL